ncbi:MAG: cytochrome c [Magnetococcales bacterium]|nr:cytochrome c [Magnetococcales bacterium]
MNGAWFLLPIIHLDREAQEQMKTTKMLMLTFLLSVYSVMPATASEFGNDLQEYQSAVMSVLRLHLKAIEMLSANQNHQYAENLLRHANALRSSAQLLDHVYPDTPQGKSGSVESKPWQDQKTFTSLVEGSFLATKELVSASEQWLKGNQERLPSAIKKVRESCDSCHRIFRTKQPE